MLKSLFNSFRSSAWSLIKKRLRRRCFLLKSLRARSFIEHLHTTASGRAQDLLITVPIAILNDVFKAYNQKWFVTCFLRSAYDRFMEFLIETYNKGSCS